jgi:hypothetical protein
MLICPSCKYLNTAGAGACAVCGETLTDQPKLPSAPTTVVNKSAKPPEPAPALTVRTPPPAASLPAPMVEPIAPPPADHATGPAAGSALTRGLPKFAPDDGSGAAAAAVTVRAGTQAGHAQPTLPGPGPFQTPAVEPKLVVVRGERPNVAYPILNGRNYIGRCADKPVDIDLEGQEAIERIWTSRQHAVLTWDGQTLVIEDLNSLNGTFVNRNRIHPGQRQVLRAGDVVQVGTVQLRVAF